MQSKITKYYLLFGIIAIVFVVFYFLRKDNHQPIRNLPYFGKKVYSEKKDTVFHTVPDFEFINQEGKKVNQEAVKGKIYVVDYFFTTCKSICPIMSNQMERVVQKFQSDKDILFLSHTVNPEEDSVPVLNAYALQHHADPNKWYFLTGSKKDLYRLAREGYLLNAEEGNGGSEDFIHTQNFALVDKERRIRGFYDGTDSLDIERLMVDIKLLSDEYKWNEKEK